MQEKKIFATDALMLRAMHPEDQHGRENLSQLLKRERNDTSKPILERISSSVASFAVRSL